MTDKVPNIQYRSSPPFKLKRKEKRSFQAINLEKQFGFIPKVIVIQRVPGYNNTIVVHAMLTEEQLDKERKLRVEKYKDGKPDTKPNKT